MNQKNSLKDSAWVESLWVGTDVPHLQLQSPRYCLTSLPYLTENGGTGLALVCYCCPTTAVVPSALVLHHFMVLRCGYH